MTTPPHDIWSQWLLHRHHGDDPQYLQTILETLAQVRDTGLDHAHLGEGETLLDVGCGDGLIALGALEQVPTSTVIFSDISSTLLQQVHQMTQDSGPLHRCQFLETTAEDSSALPEASVDVVTTRLVLLYRGKSVSVGGILSGVETAGAPVHL